MASMISKELHFDEELKKKIEFLCDFCNIKPTIIIRLYDYAEKCDIYEKVRSTFEVLT